MHILFVTISYPNSYNNQSHLFFHDQAKAINKQGNKVGVISAVPISLKQIIEQRKVNFGLRVFQKDNVNIILYQYLGIPFFYWLTNKIGLWIGKQLFKRYILENNKPNIIHTQVSLAGGISSWIKKKYGIPFIVSEHYTIFLKNNLSKWKRKLALITYQNSSYNIAVSRRLADKLQQDFHCSFDYVPNMVDVGFFKPSKIEKGTKGKKYFLNVGITKYQKNQAMLIEAFTKSFKNKLEFHLIIAGSGEDFYKLRSLVNELKMESQITLFGQASRTEVLQLMQKSSFFVLSSHYETFGVVLIEAMACGLPVISTKSGGPESIIISEKIGLLCEIRLNSLADALKTIVKIEFDKKYIRKYIVDNFSSINIVKRLIHIYDQVFIY